MRSISGRLNSIPRGVSWSAIPVDTQYRVSIGGCFEGGIVQKGEDYKQEQWWQSADLPSPRRHCYGCLGTRPVEGWWSCCWICPTWLGGRRIAIRRGRWRGRRIGCWGGCLGFRVESDGGEYWFVLVEWRFSEIGTYLLSSAGFVAA